MSVAPLAPCSASGFNQHLWLLAAPLPSAHTMSGGSSSGGFKVPTLKVPVGVDAANYLKLGQRVSTTLKGPSRRHADTKDIDPEEILVDPSNRGGAPPHVMYMHCGILAGMKKNGYDPTRPKEGMCIEYLSPQGLQRLIDHNKRFQGPLMPPIDEKEGKLWLPCLFTLERVPQDYQGGHSRGIPCWRRQVLDGFR